MYPLTTAMAEIMKISRAMIMKGRLSKIKKRRKKKKKALLHWQRLNVVTVNYTDTFDWQRRNGPHTLGALELLNGAQVS